MDAEPPPLTGLARIAWIALLTGFAGQIVLGHVIAFGLDGWAFAWHQDRVAAALWGTTEYGAEATAYRAWIQALLGGTMIAWAWTMLAIVAIPLRRRERWAVWCIVISTLHWFVIDTGVSAAHGVGINVAFNVVALASIAIPLALMIPWLTAR
ncbi:MAG TPA: hypothetical protein VK034_03030, partial [Enhygromyxa sp.]|nr:hypothetical protein [Enhygromyxa sp.]